MLHDVSPPCGWRSGYGRSRVTHVFWIRQEALEHIKKARKEDEKRMKIEEEAFASIPVRL